MVRRALIATLLMCLTLPVYAASAQATTCSATVYVEPEAELVYGTEIKQALGIISYHTGITFTQDPMDGDLDIFAADVSAAGPEAAGYYWENQIILSPDPSLYYYEQQLPRWQHNFRLRLVVHEAMHWLGAEHGTDTKSVMYPYVSDGRLRLSASDMRFLNSLECR